MQPKLKGWGICSTLLSTEYIHKLFEVLLYGRFVYSPLFIYSFTYSFIDLFKHLLCQYKLTDIYVILWVLTQYTTLFIFLDQIVPHVVIGSPESWYLCSSGTYMHRVLSFENFFNSWH